MKKEVKTTVMMMNKIKKNKTKKMEKIKKMKKNRKIMPKIRYINHYRSK